MGKRQRRRDRAKPVATTDYRDPDGNVLTLRNSVSAGTVKKLRERDASPAAAVDDIWRRRTEMLFERFVQAWTIAGLPLSGQKELLGRYRLADQETQRWVRATIDEHVRQHQPELG
jgi:hypothetical protein